MIRTHACVEHVRQSCVVVKDRGRKATFRNEEKASLSIIKVDGCLIKDSERKRCDFILTKVGVGSIVIELKGKDLATAYQQVFATLEHKECVDWLEKRRKILIICSRVPAFMSSDASFREECRRRGLLPPLIVCNQGEFHIDKLFGGAKVLLEGAGSGQKRQAQRVRR